MRPGVTEATDIDFLLMASEQFTVVIPVHNEARFITTALERLAAQLAGLDFKAILVENGSTDGTLKTAHDLQAVYPWLEVTTLEQADYGSAMRAGFLMVDSEWAVAFDIDYFSRAFVDELLYHRDTSDIVLASKRDPRTDDRRSILRQIGTRAFNLLLRILFKSSVTDTHGMKAVRRKVLENVIPDVVSREDLFDTELILRAERAGYRITEVPAVVEELRPARSSYLARVPRTLIGLFKMRQIL